MKDLAFAGKTALVTGSTSGIGLGIATRLAQDGASLILNGFGDAAEIERLRARLSSECKVRVVYDAADMSKPDSIAAMMRRAAELGGVDLLVNNAGISISKPLLDTTARDWDLQHDIMARGSFLSSREAARVMIDQNMGGDIVYIASKNSVFAGPNNIAYSATKADQAHQVRLLAAELGAHGIRVNGVNPDGVVQGSGIFAGGWGAQRAATYGIPEEELGKFYAQRTLLKREVLPEHVANAVFALTGGDLTHTTGLHVPVDAGVAAAFLR
jgi:NAD(P)-dependent dehydrogenase (short-subunit alcohol dehydrogenase family)